MILDIHGSRCQDHAEHLEILDAVRRGDPALAGERMRAHLEGVRGVLLRWDPVTSPVTRARDDAGRSAVARLA